MLRVRKTFHVGLDRPADGQHLRQQIVDEAQLELTCRVAERTRRIGMGLDEERVCSCGHTRTRKGKDKLRLSAALGRVAAGELDGVRGIQHDGISRLPHHDKSPHIHDEVMIPEGGASLR